MSTESRRALTPVAAAATAAVLWGMPGEAAAQPAWVSSGIAVSLSVGRRVEIGVAMDLRLTMLISELLSASASSCSRLNRPDTGLGLYGQAGWYHRTGWRFGTGVHGGAQLAAWPASIDAELGWAYGLRGFRDPDRVALVGSPTPPAPAPSGAENRLPAQGGDAEVPGGGPPSSREAPAGSIEGGHRLHFGVIGQAAPRELLVLGFQLPLGLDIPLSGLRRTPFFTTGLGLRFPATFGLPQVGGCITGRPLREEGALVLAPVLPGGPCARRDLDGELGSVLADAWLEDARGECASIPVFFALARDLAAVDAPPSLIARALAAAAEELHHTALCSELAASFAGTSFTPLIPPVPAARDADRGAALCRLAAEAWLDGCLGEGTAAALARRAWQAASAADVRRALAVITRDEASHAELAWAVLAFCLREGGRSVRDTIVALVRSRAAEPTCSTASFEATAAGRASRNRERLRAFGRVPQPEVRAIAQATANAARARLEPLLSAR